MQRSPPAELPVVLNATEFFAYVLVRVSAVSADHFADGVSKTVDSVHACCEHSPLCMRLSRFHPYSTCRGMDDSLGDEEARIRALRELRFSAEAREATEALVTILEDPQVRADAERELSMRRYRALFRGHRLLVGGLVVLAGVGVAVPAGAFTSWLARTGEFGDSSRSTEVDDTEWIDFGAPDAPQIVIDAYPDYLTLPDGVPPEVAITDVSLIFERLAGDAEGQAVAQEGLIPQTYEHFAICAWTDEWLEANANSDTTRAVRAATWLGDTDSYPSLVAHDGGGVIDAIQGFAAAARNGDVDSVERFYDISLCDEHLRGVNR